MLFYDVPIKNKDEIYKAITELIRNNNFATGDSLNFEYFCTLFKLIAIN